MSPQSIFAMNKMRDKSLYGIGSLVLATALFGTVGILTRLIGTGFGNFFQAAARNSIILLIIGGYILLKGGWKKINKPDYKWFFTMSLPGIITLVGLFVAFNNLAIGTTLFIFYASQTVISYIIAAVFFKEKLNTIKIASLAFCFLGLVGMYYLHFGGSPKYVLFALAAGLGVAAWNVFSKKVSSKYSLAQVLLIDCIISVPICLILAGAFNEAISLPSLTLPWVAVSLYGFIAIATGLLSIYGFKHLQAQIASVIMLLEPVFGIILSWIIFKETLSLPMLGGGAFILLGVALPNLRKTK